MLKKSEVKRVKVTRGCARLYIGQAIKTGVSRSAAAPSNEPPAGNVERDVSNDDSNRSGGGLVWRAFAAGF